MRKLIPVILAIGFLMLTGCVKQVTTVAPASQKSELRENILVEDAGSSIVGYIISHMDDYDKDKLIDAFKNGQPGIPYEWENQQAGTHYRFTYASKNPKNVGKCKSAEIYSGNKRLRSCAEVSFDPKVGWIIKTQQ